MPIDLASGQPGQPIDVGTDPVAIAIAKDGRAAYVANFQDGTVTPITLLTRAVGAPIKVGPLAAGLAIGP